MGDAYKVSFADFWGSVDLPHLQNIRLYIVDSHKLYKVTVFIITITNKLDRLHETENISGRLRVRRTLKNKSKPRNRHLSMLF